MVSLPFLWSIWTQLLGLQPALIALLLYFLQFHICYHLQTGFQSNNLYFYVSISLGNHCRPHSQIFSFLSLQCIILYSLLNENCSELIFWDTMFGNIASHQFDWLWHIEVSFFCNLCPYCFVFLLLRMWFLDQILVF